MKKRSKPMRRKGSKIAWQIERDMKTEKKMRELYNRQKESKNGKEANNTKN